MSRPHIIIIGAGGHCHSCIDVIEQDGRFEIAGIVDKVPDKEPGGLLGYPLLGCDEDMALLRQQYKYAFVGVGQIRNVAVRLKLFNRLNELGYLLPTIVSPRAYVSGHAEIGSGSIVMHNAVVNANALIGAGCILNSSSLVEHDAVVGDYTHVSTGAVVNGAARIGNCCFIGSGATVVQGVDLPDGFFVKAGSLVRPAGDCSRGNAL